MRIAASYSHLNGLEFLKVHHTGILKEIEGIVAAVDASACKTKVSKEKRTAGTFFYSPKEMNRLIRDGFRARDWNESRVSYWVTEDAKLIRKTMAMDEKQKKKEIEAAGLTPIFSYNQTDFVKNRVAVEVQFGKYAFVAFDLFVKHMAFFIKDVIDVGIEILPMKELQSEMSSGPAYYEGELYNLIREGRGVPAVPLLLIGIAP